MCLLRWGCYIECLLYNEIKREAVVRVAETKDMDMVVYLSGEKQKAKKETKGENERRIWSCLKRELFAHLVGLNTPHL